MENKNYECKRCFYNCNQLNDMKKHLNKKIKCIRKLESFNYNDDELYNLSLTKNNNNIINKEYICNNCKKSFSTNSNLSRHLSKNLCSDKNKIEIKNLANTINNIDNSTINNINNNISLNINLINSFDEIWNTNHIDNNKKLILLLNNSKFTSTLEDILENEVNLNVLIDNTTDNALVYDNKKLINMSIKDIVKKTMEKLLNHLNDFKNDIIEPNLYNIDKNIIDEQIKIAQNKYKDFNKDQDIQKCVNIFIKDIYNKKKDDTISNYNTINKLGY